MIVTRAALLALGLEQGRPSLQRRCRPRRFSPFSPNSYYRTSPRRSLMPLFSAASPSCRQKSYARSEHLRSQCLIESKQATST
jgi:hypothetical protein